MREAIGSRSTLVAVLVCALVVLAGCAGTPSDAESTAAPDAQTTQDSGGDDTGSGGADDGRSDGGSADAWAAFEFDRPAKYTFETYMEGEGDGQLVWDVTAVSGDEVTVDLQYETAETSVETSVTGTKDEVQSQLVMTPGGPFFIIALFSPTFAYYEDQTLAVGEGWSYSTSEGSASFKITDEDTYAGVECYVSEMRADGELLHEGCFAPDLGLAAYSAYYDSDGMTASIELTAYEEH